MKSAVILAAGRGTRLAGHVGDFPKGFLRLGELPIIEESIDRLVQAGIRDVLIVTGHCAAHYDDLTEGACPPQLAADSKGTVMRSHCGERAR